MIDYYKLFGLEKDCGYSEVKEKFNKKMLSLTSADILDYTFKCKYYREGFEVLTNPAVRERYDKALKNQYSSTYLTDTSKYKFSDVELTNKQIIGKLEESIIDALIVNPNLGFQDFYRKYVNTYERETINDIRKTVSPFVRTSKEALVAFMENQYNFFHNHAKKPKQKIMAMN